MIAPALFGIAAGSLWANKLRSSLTLLGVVFGVTSVMTIISALEGMMGAIEEDLAALGPTTFIVQRIGMAMSQEEFFEKLKRKPISPESAELIKDGTTLCDRVTARTYSFARVSRRDQALRQVFIMGAEPSIADMVDFPAAQGRFYYEEDES
jgi:putative ABC transport system permease protein